MKVLHIDEQSGWRGGEQQASYLIRGLTERGHRCFIAGKAQSEFLSRDHGVSDVVKIPVPCRGELDLATAWTLARAVRRHRIDILHAHSSHALTYALLARRFAGHGKVVASRRVDFPPNDNLFSRWKYRRPDRIIAISDCIGAVLRRYGVPNDRLRVVHSGIDPQRFANVAPLSRAELGVPDTAALVGNVGALVGHKDHATLINAMPYVLKEVPNAHLVIAGDGPLRPQLDDLIARLAINAHATLLGRRDDVPRLLHALDLFVMSSKEEGLGTSVLDAMACGVPVVATAAGGIPEMVKDGATGILSPVGDSARLAEGIVRVLQNTVSRDTLVENARRMVYDRFTVDRMVEGNLRVYEEVLPG